MKTKARFLIIVILILTVLSFRLVASNIAELTGRSTDDLFKLHATQQELDITVLGERYHVKPDLGQIKHRAANYSHHFIPNSSPL
ncbi:MAG: hypothetical protein ACM3UZ_10570 [Acidobacteriota bacterium]